MDVQVNSAGPETAALMALLHERCLGDEGERPWSASEFGDLLALPTSWAGVAMRGDAPVGIILCVFAGDEGELLFVGVDPDNRRLGVGEALVAAMMARASGDGSVRRVTLEVAMDNHVARRLYDRFGFREVGARTGYYQRRGGHRADALVMQVVFGSTNSDRANSDRTNPDPENSEC